MSTRAIATQLWGPDGRLVWERAPGEPHGELPEDGRAHGILARMCGEAPPAKRPTPSEILKQATRLGFVSAKGCPPGMQNVLPRGMLLERSVDAFNQEHRRALGVLDMQFPLLLDLADAELAELTRSYEVDGRMFRLGAPDETLRLAYAADPGLFSWLKGQTLDDARLPAWISSPLPAFRRWRSGEIGDLDHLRQYPLSDLHALTTAAHALPVYLENTALGAAGARFWFQEDFCLFADATAAFVAEHADIGGQLARAAQKWTLVNVLSAAPRYYAMRSGVVVDGGYRDIMIYNMQWDEENAGRFGILARGGASVVILHGNMLTGWPLLLPIFLGRALAGLAPRCMPLEVAPTQLALLPLEAAQTRIADAWVVAHPEVRSRVFPVEGPLRTRIAAVSRDWCPAFAVLGPRDKDVVITHTETRVPLGIDDFDEPTRQRLRRCAPLGYGPADPRSIFV